MAHTDALPDSTLDTITRKLGDLIGALDVRFVEGQPLELAETFSVWMLDAVGSTQVNKEVSELAQATRRWHHQIKMGGQAVAFARSSPLGPGPDDWSIEELSRPLLPEPAKENHIADTGLAADIDEAIRWIDANAQGDPLVRLLVSPVDCLTAFWLVGAGWSQVLVIDKPMEYTHLECRRLYRTREFLSLLNQEHRGFALIR